MSETSNAAAWQAAADNVIQAGQVIAQGKTNRKTRQWNEKMYKQQRQDALADWNMQNEYNSPSAQMARFRDAGLNPNLIYGQTNEGGVVRSTDVKSWNPQTPDISGMSRGMDRYFNAQMKEATINNLKAQNDNILAQKRLIDAQTMGVYKGIEDKESQIGYRGWMEERGRGLFEGEKGLQSYSLEAADWNVRHKIKDLDIKTQLHQQNLVKNAQSIQQGAERLVQMGIETHIKRLEQAYKAGMLNQQTYDRELTKARLYSEQASEMLKNEMRRGAEYINNNRPTREQTEDMFRLSNSVLSALGTFK